MDEDLPGDRSEEQNRANDFAYQVRPTVPPVVAGDDCERNRADTGRGELLALSFPDNFPWCTGLRLAESSVQPHCRSAG